MMRREGIVITEIIKKDDWMTTVLVPEGECKFEDGMMVARERNGEMYPV